MTDHTPNTRRQAVIDALRRYAARNRTSEIERQRLINEELTQIVVEVGSLGDTPAQTLSRVLQELRGELLAFGSRPGHYVLLEDPIDVTDFRYDLDEDLLEDALIAGKVIFPDVEVSETQTQVRVRVGQSAIRKLVLKNYQSKCAICDVTSDALLVASHIASWSKHPQHRGDLSNVICLCSFHDKLFDRGFISFGDDLGLLSRPDESETVKHLIDVTTRFNRDIEIEPNPEFLKVHRILWGYE